MKYFEVGMTVYCAIYGKGIVDEILSHPDYQSYPIRVRFNSGINPKYYSVDGRSERQGGNIVLSQNPIPPIVNTPLAEYNLTFAEAMEAVVNGKKVQCEKWNKEVYIQFEQGVVDLHLSLKSKDSSTLYHLYFTDITSKWRIIED